jgi:hypothetical protein
MNKNKYGIIFHFSFGAFWGTEDRKMKGKILKWDTMEEANRYGQNNCGLNFYEAREIPNDVNDEILHKMIGE